MSSAKTQPVVSVSGKETQTKSSKRLQKKSKDLILIGDDSDGSEEEDDETALAQEDTRDVYDDIYNSIME